MDVGECYFSTKEGYDFLKQEMVEYAEKELSKRSADQYSLDVRVYDYEEHLINLLVQKGYHKVYSEPIRVYNYVSGFPRAHYLRDSLS